ncbi:hypothetical protein EJB05_44059, partial [Eragrostis curvula]
MKVETHLRMATGDGVNSYASNSRLPMKALLKTGPIRQKAIQELYSSCLLHGTSTLVIADLGCSSGPNALFVVSEVMSTLRAYIGKGTAEDQRHAAVEVQFFLNDLPGNDFNLVFQSLESVATEDMAAAPPCYVAGLPGSYYTRLFPCQSVHLFHSSFSLMFRSKVPDDLSNGTHRNEDNIYIGRSTPPSVVQMFQEQFRKDFKLFLTLRHKELVSGGRMILTFLGRKGEEMLMHGDVDSMFELLSVALNILVKKGRVEKEKLNSFNLPYYAPSISEVKALIKEDLFSIEQIELFESNWDPHDDSDSNVTLDCIRSGQNIANNSIRAVMEPLIIEHFGEAILDELFIEFSSIVAKHLEKLKAKYSVIIVSLKKAIL